MSNNKDAKQTALNQKLRRELPFKTRPKGYEPRIVGDESSGTLEIPIYGSLTVGENLEFIALVERTDIKKLQERGEAMVTQAQELVKAGEDVEDADTRGIMSNLDVALVFANYNVETATIILRGRIDHDWTVADTQGLSSKLVADIAKVLQDEVSASTERNKKPTDKDAQPIDPQ